MVMSAACARREIAGVIGVSPFVVLLCDEVDDGVEGLPQWPYVGAIGLVL
jgi:hypothetical protein